MLTLCFAYAFTIHTTFDIQTAFIIHTAFTIHNAEQFKLLLPPALLLPSVLFLPTVLLFSFLLHLLYYNFTAIAISRLQLCHEHHLHTVLGGVSSQRQSRF